MSPSDGAVNVPIDEPIVVGVAGIDGRTVQWTVLPPIVLVPTWDPSNTVLTLSHASLFSACTRYSLSAEGRDPQGNPFNVFWSFTTQCQGPHVVSTYPPSGSLDIPLDAPLIVGFSHRMDPATVPVTISPTIALTPSWSQNDTTLTLTHETPFAPGTIYSVSLRGRDIFGDALLTPPPVGWSFTTGGPALPYITYTDPSDGATAVPLSKSVIVQFSEPMDTNSVNWSVSPWIEFEPNWRNSTLTLAHAADFQSCTRYTIGIRGSDYQGDPLGPGPVPNPWNFTTVCGQPHIVYTNPQDGAAQVPRDAPILAVFSEPMNATSVSVGITPSIGNVNLGWTAPDVLVVTHDPFVPCRQYTVLVNGTDLDGQDLVPGPVPNPWSFTVSCATVGVQLVSPLGGESWTGGTSHPIRFRIVNVLPATQTVNVTATVRLASGGGVFFASQDVTVLGGRSVAGEFPWTTPLIGAVDVLANLTAVASPAGDVAWDESGPFEIDSTPPVVVSATPSGPRVPPDPTIVVRFSEPMAVTTSDPITLAPTVAHTFSWPAADRFEARLAGTVPCTMYTVALGSTPVTLRDDSDPGNPLPPMSWTFTTECVPSANLLAPDGGEDWTGGTVHAIRWTTADGDDPTLLLDLYYSTDGGATYPNAIAIGMPSPVGAGSYDWLVPRIDSKDVRVRIVATDAAGNVASDQSRVPFTIDSTPPTLLASFPSNGGIGHKTTRDLYFVFSERVDRASFEAAFSLTPNPGGLRLAWSVSNLGTDVLTVAHDPLKAYREYVASFADTAKDDSDPGNRLVATLAIRFSTQPPPDVAPPVAKAVGKSQVQAWEVVTLDGSQSTGNIVQYVWRIRDNQDRFVAVLLGVSVPVMFREHGRYHVTLIVTDANGASDEDTIEIAVTSNPNGIVVISGVILLSAALTAATESGRAGFFAFVVAPLYVRRKRNEVLEHQTRGMILGYILVHPGDSYTDIKRNLLLSNGTLSYHLAVLEKEGLIRSQVRGPRKLFYPLGVRMPEDGGGMHELQVRIFRAVQNVPGLAVKDLAGALGITSQHALYHVRELAAQGFVRLERRGVTLRAYAEEGKSVPMHREDEA